MKVWLDMMQTIQASNEGFKYEQAVQSNFK